MHIRTALPDELDSVMDIYASAQRYMARTGNPNQWGTTHPPRTLIQDDIKLGRCFVGVDQAIPHCVFALIEGADPTYTHIYDGNWLNDEPYLTIHRVASDGTHRGVFSECVDFCRERADEHSIWNLRADTHDDNKAMQHALERCGFICCGRINLADGNSRIAYQLAFHTSIN